MERALALKMRVKSKAMIVIGISHGEKIDRHKALRGAGWIPMQCLIGLLVRILSGYLSGTYMVVFESMQIMQLYLLPKPKSPRASTVL